MLSVRTSTYWCSYAGSLESTRDAWELLETQPRETLAAWVLFTLPIHNSTYAELKHEPLLLEHRMQICLEKKSLLKLYRIYPKTMNKWKGINDHEHCAQTGVTRSLFRNFILLSENPSLFYLFSCKYTLLNTLSIGMFGLTGQLTLAE